MDNSTHKPLTVARLEAMQPGCIFATGVGMEPAFHTEEIRWVAVRGGGMADWALYYHKSFYPEAYVRWHGDKATTESVIKRLVPCDEEAWKRYRF